MWVFSSSNIIRIMLYQMFKILNRVRPETEQNDKIVFKEVKYIELRPLKMRVLVPGIDFCNFEFIGELSHLLKEIAHGYDSQ